MLLHEVRQSATWGKHALRYSALLLAGATAFGQSKLSKDLAQAKAGSQVDVIVQFNTAPTAALHQHVLRSGGSLKRELASVKGSAYTIPQSALADLANATWQVIRLCVVPTRLQRTWGVGS